MNFNFLVENIIDNKDIYTVNELKDYVIWVTNIKNLPTVKQQIQKNKLYQQGARVLVPVFDAPNNEITDKAKELVNINGENVIKSIKELRTWAQDNVTPERKKELGIKEVDTYLINSTKSGLSLGAGLSLGVSKALIEAYSKGILVMPKSTYIKYTNYVYDILGRKLHIIIRNEEYKDFKKIAEWRQIKAYKEFFQFNDKEVEQDWGGIIDEL